MKDKKRDNRARDGDPSRVGRLKRGSFQTPGNPLTRETGGSFQISVGQPNGGKRNKTHRLHAYKKKKKKKKTPSRKVPQTISSATSKWGLNGEERAALLRVRTRPECPDGNQKELA